MIKAKRSPESLVEYLLLAIAALGAGFIDAVAGGGGLIQIPALFAAYPNQIPAAILGTNKLPALLGTSSAALRYARQVRINWRIAGPATLAAPLGGWCGAWTVSVASPELVRPLIPVLLVLMAIYTYLKKDLGGQHAPRYSGTPAMLAAAGVGLALGFYEGFLGPGMGALLIFAFVRIFGFDFLNASATSKIVNVVSNVASLAYFGSHGHVWWTLGLWMALFNIAGNLLGSRLAIKNGAGFVRQVFLLVVSCLVVKLVLAG